MSLLTILRVLKLGWFNYWRNKGLSLSATLILTLTLFIVVIFLILNIVLSAAATEIRSKIDLVVTFDDEVPAEQIDNLQALLAIRPEVKEVKLITKETALERFQDLPGVSERTKQLVTPENNPLPRSLEIKVTDPNKLEHISGILTQSPWKEIIRRNSYLTNKDTIQKLSRFETAVLTTGVSLSVAFVIISLIVVINTVRLAIFARHKEVEIMRLVGANNIFIRIPFMVEGFLYGLIASLLALGLSWFVLQNATGLIDRYLAEINIDLLMVFTSHLPLVIVIELIIGLGVAVFASLVSIQRYLKI